MAAGSRPIFAGRRLYEQIQKEIRELLGEPPGSFSVSLRYGALPPDKRELLQQIERDYSEMQEDINRESMGLTLASDREKLRLLEAEKRKDLAGVLSPAELLEYDLRASPTAGQLRTPMAMMEATKEEYRAIFPLQQAYDQQWRPSYWTDSSDDPGFYRNRQEAGRQLAQRIKEFLGPERGQLYLWAQEPEFGSMYTVANRLGLPAETPARVMQLRDSTSSRGVAILDDKTLTNDQRRAMIQGLAQEARSQLNALLPAEAQQQLGARSLRWVSSLDRGSVTTYNSLPGSSSISVRSVPRAAPTPPPRPPGG
ncbi:MAG: hypothetical protein A3G75_02305 [Verrucomicrobia bacterium RIFCSPLOWO2_12_FULL_64_8]|nr:MAG: hypothetical protein A3G75_02305 [Verrucomicrobia bacterium RIFCSPLOWO2_12_FULL_64_8]